MKFDKCGEYINHNGFSFYLMTAHMPNISVAEFWQHIHGYNYRGSEIDSVDLISV